MSNGSGSTRAGVAAGSGTSGWMTETSTSSSASGERRRVYSWLDDPRRTVVLYVAAFVVIEALGAYVSIALQAVLTAVAAFISVNLAIFGYRTKRTAGLVMAAIFTSRLTAITLPAAGVSIWTRTALVAITTVLVAYIATWVLGLDIASGRVDEGFPLRKPLLSRRFTTLLALLAGFPVGWAAHRLLDPDSLVVAPIAGADLPWLGVVGAFAIGALAEELLYRRLVAAMVQHTGQSQTPVVSGVLFGAAYLGTRNLLFVGLAFATGTLWAWTCECTGSIKGPLLGHFIVSLLTYVVL